MRMRALFVVVGIASAGVAAACGDDSDGIGDSADAGGQADTAPPEEDAAMPDASDEPDAEEPFDAAHFCSAVDAQICEDFEAKVIPPKGWTSRVAREAGTLSITQGYGVGNAMSARLRTFDASASDESIITRSFSFAASHTKLTVSARIRVLDIASPYGRTDIVVVGLGPQASVALTSTGALTATVSASNGADEGPVFPTTLTVEAWHLVEIVVTRGDTDATLTARLDGKTLGTGTIAAIENVAKSITVGVRGGPDDGNRNVAVDDVVVRTE